MNRFFVVTFIAVARVKESHKKYQTFPVAAFLLSLTVDITILRQFLIDRDGLERIYSYTRPWIYVEAAF